MSLSSQSAHETGFNCFAGIADESRSLLVARSGRRRHGIRPGANPSHVAIERSARDGKRVIMIENPDSDIPMRAADASERREREHARRNALQADILRRAGEQCQHHAHIENALRRIRQEDAR